MTHVAVPAPRHSRGRRAFQWFSLLAVVAIPLAAIIWLAGPDAACACTRTPELPASPVEGVVIAVDSAGLGQVRGFTLRSDGGFAYVLKLGPLDNATGFSPSHLTEHMASSGPIRAFYRMEAGVPTVYRLEDASGG